MRYNKKLRSGYAERCDLLAKVSRRSLERLHSDLARYSRQRLKPDDAVDALALSLGAARIAGHAEDGRRDPSALDPMGLPMEMLFPDPDQPSGILPNHTVATP
jgi:predicted RNase H-like nuclease